MIKNLFRQNVANNMVGISLLLLTTANSFAQNNATDSTPVFKPHGVLWGNAFGDFAYKSNSDILNRGGGNQYTGVPISTNLFQWRRVYLGYNYDITSRFSAELILSGEADYAPPFSATTGDLLMNNKLAPFIKIANIRWKEIWKGTDLVIGQQNTSAYGKNGRNDQTPEEVWSYRSVEKTVSDLYGTPCYDMGASLQGWFDAKGNFGYEVMAGNGTMAKPENDMYKWFYADVYAKFFDKKLLIDLYQDYSKINWGVYTKGPNGAWYHDRTMTKLFLAYTTPKLTVGFEGFNNTILGDIKVTGKDGNTYYRTEKAAAVSFFVRGRILSDGNNNARLGYFARYDNFDPTGNLNAIASDANAKSYTAITSAYDPTTKQQFALLGLDYTPTKHVHIMPNLWLFDYTSALSPTPTNVILNPGFTGIKGTDVVWRVTFFYSFGK